MSSYYSSAKRRHFNRRQFLRTGSAAATAVWAGSSVFGLMAQDIRQAGRSAPVQTRYGRLQGARFAGDVDAFYGIPYGAPTAGAGRFQAPREPASWSGIKQALAVGNRAPQGAGAPLSEVAALDRQEPMGEDCLNLNVFTPGASGGKKPVMVWLHGGGFTSGSGGWLLYDGTNLARGRDVVVVTVNHRLNVFGHLHLGELGGGQYADSGNAGMLDIVAALQWVRDNIEAFGGDPDNVTIFGQSGGGGKVSTLLAMPAAKGLFHKAIAMSGSNVRGVPASEASEGARRFMAALDLRPDQVDRLQSLPVTQLLKAYQNTPGLPLAPVVDGNHLPADPFYPEAPAQSTDVPMLLGTTEHEVNFIPATPLDPIDDSELLERVKQTLGGGDESAARLIDVYREGRPGVSNVELYQVLASDNSFRRGVIAQAELKAQQQAPVYMYYFRWNSPVRAGKLRAYHCLDIPFAFDNVDECSAMTGAGQDRYALAEGLAGAFAAFARSGDPYHAALPSWPRFDGEQRATMMVDDGFTVMNDPYGAERRALYES